ncbi:MULTISPECIES: SRPBCC domain-containing protein [unclassified Mesorhizobium]|uniref:CoxG family protein n=1 Tax=unclassified Mesorhizobium TaxID=325217 RepID=UPI001FDFC1CF|nr:MULTISPECIES: SRPBCC domain-containing protein [unclassified Mesorhizobium]
MQGEGKGGIAGFAKGGADVTLAADGADTTILKYAAMADVGGKIAQLGSRLIRVDVEEACRSVLLDVRPEGWRVALKTDPGGALVL